MPSVPPPGPEARRRPAIIGHAGGGKLGRANTIAGIEAGLGAGVDVIELDIRRAVPGRRLFGLRAPARSGALQPVVLAHDERHARPGQATSFDAALDFIARQAPPSTDLLLDFKQGGIEDEVVAALERADLSARAILCSGSVDTLRQLRQDHPAIRRAWSLETWRQAARAGLSPDERDVAGHAATAVTEDLAVLLSVHRSLATADLIAAVHRAGGLVYAWSVDRPEQAAALCRLGVDGLTGDDPLSLRSACDDSSPAWTSS